ncbi:dehydrogenase [Spirochaetia bacterium]|nr:dehydrogenase [Spirochaetia bacterium]GHU34827.1 dehydrogenase [Spirochaetia bacterium]
MNWALVGTGGITNNFLTGLRAVADANIVAVVSRAEESARQFSVTHNIEKSYTDYDQMLEDPAIDIIYLGTPHTTHKDYAIRAFSAKKAVLCEKPAAINAHDLEEMIATARKNHVFFMEAMWTRFVPPLCKVREWLRYGLIGEIKMVEANFGFSVPWKPAERWLNPALGGGALLDAGVYPISLASMIFGGKKPEKIVSILNIGKTGVDEEVSAVLSYNGRIANISTALCTKMVNDAYIYGTNGYIHLPDFVFSHHASLFTDGKYHYNYEPEFISNGYNYEAEEVISCIRAGKIESDIMPLDESLAIAHTLDTIRFQNNFKYPGEK